MPDNPKLESITEAGSVQAPFVRHAESVGWKVIPAEDSLARRRGPSGLFHYDTLATALLHLNPGVVTSANVQSIIDRLEAVPTTLEGNREMLEYLRGHLTVAVPEERRQRNVVLMDFAHPERNTFEVTSEWRYQSPTGKGNRVDVMFLVNGIPVALVECKSPKLPDAMDRALKQLRRYEAETPQMLASPQVFNVTHLLDYLYGVTWNYHRQSVVRWKDTPDESYVFAVQSFFDRHAFLRLLEEWVVFYVKDDELKKTLLRQHQTRAAMKVVARCADPTKHSGLVWHTQGSGKTFTLLTAARLILEDRSRFPGATVLLVVDRNELEGQLSGWVTRLMGEMQSGAQAIQVEVATSHRRLQTLLDADFRGLIISMIHKFENISPDSCVRRDVFVLIDEAHRSTGGDLGNALMGALPNATFIGFTGTPIDRTAHGHGTFKTFAREDADGYLDKYSIRESIEDGTTLKLRHALAPNALRVPEGLLDEEFLQLAATEGLTDIEDLNHILDRAVRLKTFLKAEDRIDHVARFVAGHFREHVEPLGYKAFLVAVDREACARYKEALDRYLPHDVAIPVYTPNPDDSLERPLVAAHQLDESREKEVRKAFTKPGEKPQILIVTDKLLTGYDAPILYCLYLDKPMRDHVLLQALARVNRPYEDDAGHRKPCGLIVDFVGILKNLNKALRFDADDVHGAIEDLDILFARFEAVMTREAPERLAAPPGPPDEQIEHLLYEVYFDPTRRQAFFDFFEEIQTLYEILSPDPALRHHLQTYQRLAELYKTLRNAYATGSVSPGPDLARKTEQLLQAHVKAGDVTPAEAFVEYGVETLAALQMPHSDRGKVMNLVRTLRQEATELGSTPALRTLAERAEVIRAAFEDRQLATRDALGQLQMLLQERDDAAAEQLRLGMDDVGFGAYQLLRAEKIADAEGLAREITGALHRFPDFATSAEERRQLTAEIYRCLLGEVTGARMVALGDHILALAMP